MTLRSQKKGICDEGWLTSLWQLISLLLGLKKGACQLFTHFSFLVAPSGRHKKERGAETVRENQRCRAPPQRTSS